MTDEPEEFLPKFLRELGKNLESEYEAAGETRQYDKMTPANLLAMIDAFSATVGPVNDLAAAADKKTEWLREERKNVLSKPFPGPPLDLRIAGGGKQLHAESETAGGARAQATDRKKLIVDPMPSDVNVMLVRNKSAKHSGSTIPETISASKKRKGPFVGVEINLPEKAPLNKASFRIFVAEDGEKIYDESHHKK